MVSHERLKQILHYDPVTGLWTWMQAPYKRPDLLYTEAGHLAVSDGARRIMIDRQMYRACRLAWLYMTGEWPEDEIDHRDRDPSNDCWKNLREATSTQNKHNTKLNSRNTSGVRGVSWHTLRNKWRVQVDKLYLGLFDDLDEAIAVRDRFAKTHHGEFAQLN